MGKQKSLAQLISSMDDDGDGVVNAVELKDAGSAGDAILRMFDQDGDGQIDDSEMLAMKGVMAQKDQHGELRLLKPATAVQNVRQFVEQRLKYKTDYLQLLYIVIFFVIYSTSVVLSNLDVAATFETRQKIVDTLFGQSFDPETTTVETDSGFIVQTLDSRSNIYKWLDGLIDGIYTEPICGDGKCKGEQAGWRPSAMTALGCSNDCGDYQYQEPVSIEVSGIVAAAQVKARDGAAATKAANPLSKVFVNLCYDENKDPKNALVLGEQTCLLPRMSILDLNKNFSDSRWAEDCADGTLDNKCFLHQNKDETLGPITPALLETAVTIHSDIFAGGYYNAHLDDTDHEKLDYANFSMKLHVKLIDGPYKLIAYYRNDDADVQSAAHLHDAWLNVNVTMRNQT
eukprot:g6024.t1